LALAWTRAHCVRPKAFLFFFFLSLSLCCSFAKCASRASNYFINHLGAVVVTVVVVVAVVVADAPRLAECVWRVFFYGSVPTLGLVLKQRKRI